MFKNIQAKIGKISF